MGGLSLLQGIFPTHGLNLGLPDSLRAEPQEKTLQYSTNGLLLFSQMFWEVSVHMSETTGKKKTDLGNRKKYEMS